ncbi:hypothetical protein SEA_PHRANNY_43 [Mycobacterium phage Phranny]|uniref:Lipoprotein n=1 Tax=Mycobacterium phage PurpleHaze TaxID=1983577 RepID=A0A220NRV6_9CAUD|nr:hypothetical protein KIJ57_gp51 [Mycobacterium phage Purple Haze]AXC35148.1 hypothetical protein SEA_PHRANNY_43 [Mycobacterium phage Phranny]AXH44668.1 hypothetical protein SEA_PHISHRPHRIENDS_40 [Mycobacterium phage PhishRPhriends]AXH44818.1 hypothetical protein SEA_REBA_42 [Mycobacterium phage Reba]AZF96811.1 hypothetical protein SEA_KALB97_43 [Mycobacterium Phage Kalb97]QAY02968.1 hypothetical protein SEA_GEMMA_41 [Mycobacterium phage Gemma]QDM57623.1 hypothetical protein SEA_GROUPTHINK_
MKKFIAAALIALSALGLTACEGESGTTTTTYDDGPNGVIFMPMPGNPVGMPIFF